VNKKELWVNCVYKLAEDDSASEFGGRQSSGSRGTPSGQQWQSAPRENSLPAARYGSSLQTFCVLYYSVDRTKWIPFFLLFMMLARLPSWWLYGCILVLCTMDTIDVIWWVLLSQRMIFLLKMSIFILATAESLVCAHDQYVTWSLLLFAVPLHRPDMWDVCACAMCSAGNKKQASAYFYSDSEEENAPE